MDQPAEEVPAELPEPCLGINFARDGMPRRDWLALVAVHSDAWLLRWVPAWRRDMQGRGRHLLLLVHDGERRGVSSPANLLVVLFRGFWGLGPRTRRLPGGTPESGGLEARAPAPHHSAPWACYY